MSRLNVGILYVNRSIAAVTLKDAMVRHITKVGDLININRHKFYRFKEVF